MGQKLINLPRPKVFTPYKPKTPIIIWRDEEKPFLSSFIGEKSWLLFHLLKLNRTQEWLNVPSEHWNKFEDFNSAKKFVCNLSCANDIAERGIRLIGDIKDKYFNPVEREQLAQVVEKHRNSFNPVGKRTSMTRHEDVRFGPVDVPTERSGDVQGTCYDPPKHITLLYVWLNILF